MQHKSNALLIFKKWVAVALTVMCVGVITFACTDITKVQEVESSERPNIVIIMADDMGFSDIGPYGSEINTPNLDRLAAGGIRFTEFFNMARCVPTRASLLTGLYPHQAGLGDMTYDAGIPAYQGDINDQSVTIAQVLQDSGYATYMSGKWHVTAQTGYWATGERAQRPYREGWHPEQTSQHNWPRQRGFDRFFGTIEGAGNYFAPITLTENNTPIDMAPEDFYYTDAIGNHAVQYVKEHHNVTPEQPFFLYVAYTAPHWPLHALEEDIEKYRGMYDEGWEPVRVARYQRLWEMELIDNTWQLSPPDETVPAWENLTEQERIWYRRAMEVYAAQIDRMDQNIGHLLDALDETGQLENTLLLFLSDNGGCDEVLTDEWRGIWMARETRQGNPVVVGNENTGVLPGPEATYMSYGPGWANVSNTPLRQYKWWTHQGGIVAPFIVHWPSRIPDGGLVMSEVGSVLDLMATAVDAASATYPTEWKGVPIHPMEGRSLLPAFHGKPLQPESLFWEHEGNRAVRSERWKLVATRGGDWELYDLKTDRSELNNLADQHLTEKGALIALYNTWANRVGVSEDPIY